MVPDALCKRVPEMMDTPPIRNNYAFIIFGRFHFLETYSDIVAKNVYVI